ncbi:MAG: hypothetical protein OXF65_14750 [Acidimicrobiaceae bacterium]|nr:hypothetical protein [Acidimicrobiaceae bacterium]
MSKIKGISIADIREHFEFVDDPDAVERAQRNPALRAALRWLRPPNWHGSGLTPEQVLPIASESGIPVAWVPPRSVLIGLAAAEPKMRVAALMAFERAVLDDCKSVLEECDDPELHDSRTLAGRAVCAFESGHHEAAMALAVAVAEQPAIWASERRVEAFLDDDEQEAYEKAIRKKYSLATSELEVFETRRSRSPYDVPRRALLSPIPKFFKKFYPEQGDAVPETASRHATVHQPTIEHLSRENSLLAIMLCSSLLREQQAWILEVRD